MHSKSQVSVSTNRILPRVASRPCCSLPLNIMTENCHQVVTITIIISNPEILAWFEPFDSATACPGRVYFRPVCPNRYEIGTRKIFLRMLTFVYANLSARKTESGVTSIMVPFANSFCPRSRVNPPFGVSGSAVSFRTGKV